MKIKSIILLVILLFVIVVDIQARGKQNDSCRCSVIIKKLSRNWRADSLAGNGFRWKNYKQLRTCKLDSLSVSFLLHWFGKPTEISKYTNQTRDYTYYYYDYKHLDTIKYKKGGPLGFDFLNFTADTNNTYIINISKGSGEY